MNRSINTSFSREKVGIPMSSQAATPTRTNTPTNVAINDDKRNLLKRHNERVAQRAYELFERGGASNGNDLEHWLQAETELLGKVSEIRETGDEYVLDIPIDGFHPEDIYVGVDASRVIILAENHGSSNGSDAPASNGEQRALFLAAKWPTMVHAETAKAQSRNGHLLLTVMRASYGQNSHIAPPRNPSLK